VTPRTVLALLAALLVVAAGCGERSEGGGQGGNQGGNSASFESPGGNAESSSENIAAADVDRVLEAEESANTSCGLIRDQEGSDLPLDEAVATLIDVMRRQPEGVVAAGVQNRQRNMTTIVQDVANTLRTCPRPNPQASQRLQRAVDEFGAET